MGAAFGIAGESDTVERLRTPSVVSNFEFLRTRTACVTRLLEKDAPARLRTRSPYRPRCPRPRGKIAHTTSFNDSFQTRPRLLTKTWSKDAFNRLLPTYHLLTCTRALGFRPCFGRALFRGPGCDRREGHFHDVLFPTLAGHAATRAVLCRFIVSRPFATSPRTSRHPRRFFQLRGPRPLPANLVKRPTLLRPGMPSFGGRWSAAPPRGGSPFG
jgi:hypothetical protein